MTLDPLSVFLRAKTAAAAAPGTSMGDLSPKQVTKNPDPHSLDPGERAIAGLMAAGGSIAAKVVPWLANNALRSRAESGSFKWNQVIPKGGASYLSDLPKTPSPAGPILGLFNVKARVHQIGDDAEKAKIFNNWTRLGEMRQVVDTFIERHGLAEKGVKLNLSRGPLGSLLGPRYNLASKEVFLPQISKEFALHELGHAADYTGSRLGRARGLLEPVLQRSILAALPIALIAGDRIKEMLPGTIDDHAIQFMQDHAPLIAGATLAATSLYPEAKASALAIQHIYQMEGPAAARAATMKLLPAWGTYLLGAIPAVVGLALARKYMNKAREEKAETRSHVDSVMRGLDKTGGELASFFHGIGDAAKDVGFIGRQIGEQTADLVRHPHTIRRVGAAAKEVGTSPEFIYGALASAVPAAIGSLYLYNTQSGHEIRKRIHSEHLNKLMTKQKYMPLAGHAGEAWREQHPLRFASLVAAGAALSGGILSKFMSDLQRVL